MCKRQLVMFYNGVIPSYCRFGPDSLTRGAPEVSFDVESVDLQPARPEFAPSGCLIE